jgi:hypothetical protein
MRVEGPRRAILLGGLQAVSARSAGAKALIRGRDTVLGTHRQFGAQPAVLPMGGQPEPGSWSVPITDGELVVSEATSDLRAMPPAMIHAAIRLLGTAPVYCLSIFAAVGQSTGAVVPVEDSDETAQLVQRIVNAFGERWPAVLSDNSTAPMIALGPLATQAPQEHRPVPKRGWRRFLGR